MPVAVAPPPTTHLSRDAIARLVGARRGDVVHVTASPAAAYAGLARRLPEGPVLVLDTAGGGPAAAGLAAGGRAVRVIPAAATLAGTVARVTEALAERPAALLAVPGADAVTGELLPVAQLADAAHAHGAALVVDAALLAPAGRLDLAAARVDHAVVSAAELPARFAAGALVGRPLAEPAEPVAVPVPRAVAAALAAACGDLAGLPAGELAAHVARLREQLAGGLRELPGVRVLRHWPDATAHAGALTLTVAGWSPAALLAHLTRLVSGVAAVPPLDAAGEGLRVRLRASTSDAEVDALLDALEDVVTGPRP